MKSIHVACGQIVCRPGDIRGNLQQISKLSAEASAVGAKLILFGEGALTGYLLTKKALGKAPSVDSAPVRKLLQIAKEDGVVIVTGTLETSEEEKHVSAFIAYPNSRLLVQRKHNLTPKEQKAGIVLGPEERTIFSINGVKFAVCICADSGIPDIWNKLARQGCHVYLGPTAGGGGRRFMHHAEDLEKPRLRKKYLESMEKVCYMGPAIDNCVKHHMALLATNLSGDDGFDNYHPGHSSIIDSMGKTVGLIPGEYVVEFLRPQMIHGKIVVQKPKTAIPVVPSAPVSASAVQ